MLLKPGVETTQCWFELFVALARRHHLRNDELVLVGDSKHRVDDALAVMLRKNARLQ